jgi:hypothetical protein
MSDESGHRQKARKSKQAAASAAGEEVTTVSAVDRLEAAIGEVGVEEELLMALRAAVPTGKAPRDGESAAVAVMRLLREEDLGVPAADYTPAQRTRWVRFLGSETLREVLEAARLPRWVARADAAVRRLVGDAGDTGDWRAGSGATTDGETRGASASIVARGTALRVFCAVPGGLIEGLPAEAVACQFPGLPDVWHRLVAASLAPEMSELQAFRTIGVSRRFVSSGSLQFMPPGPRLKGPGLLMAVPFLAPKVLAEGDGAVGDFVVADAWGQVTAALSPLQERLMAFVDKLVGKAASGGSLREAIRGWFPSDSELEAMGRGWDLRARGIATAGLAAPDIQVLVKLTEVLELGRAVDGGRDKVKQTDFALKLRFGQVQVAETDPEAVGGFLTAMKVASECDSIAVADRWVETEKAHWEDLVRRQVAHHDGLRLLQRVPRQDWEGGLETFGLTWRDFVVVATGDQAGVVDQARVAAWRAREALLSLADEVEVLTVGYGGDAERVGRLAAAFLVAVLFATGSIPDEAAPALHMAVWKAHIKSSRASASAGDDSVAAPARASPSGGHRGGRGGGRGRGRGGAARGGGGSGLRVGGRKVAGDGAPAVPEAEPAPKRANAGGGEGARSTGGEAEHA